MTGDIQLLGNIADALDDLFGVEPKSFRRDFKKCVFSKRQLEIISKAASLEEQAAAKEKKETEASEKAFFDILSKQFGKESDAFFKDKKTQEAIHALADPANWYFDKDGKPLRPKPAVWTQYKNGAEEYLGQQLARHVKTRLSITVKDIYETVKRLNQEGVLQVPFKWNAKTDTTSVEKLNKDVMYWVSTANGRQFEPEVAKVTQDVMSQGLGFRETEDEMNSKLASTYADKSDAYWYLMGNVGVQRARSFAKLSAFEDAGVTEYEIMAVLDNRTTPQCRYMDGRIYKVTDGQAIRDNAESSSNPEQVRQSYPWIRFSSSQAKQGLDALYVDKPGGRMYLPQSTMNPKNLTSPVKGPLNSNEELVLASTVPLPPYHGNCRTTYVITEKAIQQLTQEQVEEETQVGVPPFDPETIDQKPGTVGSHGAYWGTDKDGEDWLIKPATFAKETDVDPWMNFGVGEFMKEAGLEAPTFYVGQAWGKNVSIQSKIPNILMDGNGPQIASFRDDQVREIQKQFIFDWMVGNYDGNRDNHAVKNDGSIVGLDKGQAFKCYGNDKLDGKWRPLNNVGIPMFYEALDAYRTGKDVRLQPFDSPEIQGFIKKIQDIPQDRLKEMFLPYATRAEAAKLKVLDETNAPVYEFTTEKFFNILFERQKNLKDDFAKLYAQAEKERKDALAPPLVEKPKPKARRPKKGEAELPIGVRVDEDIPFIDPQLLSEAVAARANGKGFILGGPDWFRNEAIAYVVEGSGEGRGLHVEGRLSNTAAERLMNALGNFNVSKPQDVQVDALWQKVEPIFKSIKAHHDPDNSHFDGKFKPETEDAWKKTIAELQQALIQSGAGSEAGAQTGAKLKHYIDILETCAKVDFKAPKTDKGFPLVFKPECLKASFAPWTPPKETAPKKEAGARADGITDVKQEQRFDWNRERSATTNKVSTTKTGPEKYIWNDAARMITFKVGNAEFEFHPNEKNTPVALRGKIIMRLKEKEDQNAKGVQQALKDFQAAAGVEARPASRVDLEVAYLRKWAVMAGQHDDWKKQIPETEPPEKQLEVLRKLAADAVGTLEMKKVTVKELLKRDTYNFDVKYQQGVGWATFGDRFEMDKDTFNKKFRQVALMHNLNSGIPGLIKNITTQNTPYMVSTEEKIRTGISAPNKLSGMSPLDDRISGGSDFHFTRLSRDNDSGQLVYNRRLLLSLDSTSFDSDNYGAQRGDGRWDNRNATLQDAIGSISKYGNETNAFKWVHLAEHLEAVIVGSSQEQVKVVKALKDQGIDRLGGDRVEDRVVIGFNDFKNMKARVGDFKA